MHVFCFCIVLFLLLLLLLLFFVGYYLPKKAVIRIDPPASKSWERIEITPVFHMTQGEDWDFYVSHWLVHAVARGWELPHRKDEDATKMDMARAYFDP